MIFNSGANNITRPRLPTLHGCVPYTCDIIPRYTRKLNNNKERVYIIINVSMVSCSTRRTAINHTGMTVDTNNAPEHHAERFLEIVRPID